LQISHLATLLQRLKNHRNLWKEVIVETGADAPIPPTAVSVFSVSEFGINTNNKKSEKNEPTLF
jgi:hypothetical protein